MGKEKTVNVKLKEILTQRSVSMRSLANHIGVSYQQVSKYCNGSNEPSLSALKQITGFLNCSVTDIYPDITFPGEAKQGGKTSSTTITENHYHNYHNQSFLGRLMQMDPHLLKNQISYIVVFIGTVVVLLIGWIGYSMFDKSDYTQYLLSSYHLASVMAFLLSIMLMIVFSLLVKTTVLTYLVSWLAFEFIVFRFYHLCFGLVGDNEITRWLLRGLALILAIIWVQIAKKIRNKV